jgi:hypothetical protein
MNQSPGRDEAPANHRRLEITIYQIGEDAVMRRNRDDGTGWDWCWAEWQREWMEATPSRFAYRCLPLTIANQTGLWVKNPVGFTATWWGSERPRGIDFQFDQSPEVWSPWISDAFGGGIITWNSPFLFRTKPEGSRLMVSGPANTFKENVHPLTAILESDWMTMSFTMNWKILRPGHPVRFEAGDAIFQAIPLLNNACADIEGASVTYKRLDDDPELSRPYREWDRSRQRFTERSRAGENSPGDWQKDYFLGRDALGQQSAPLHMTKVRPPKVFHGASEMPMATEGASPPRRPAKPASATPSAAGEAADFLPVDDQWRRWIGENLLLGASRDSILKAMVARRLSPTQAAAEIDRALSSPYLWAAERVCNRLKKRDWLLAAYRKLNRLRPGSGEVARRHKLSRDDLLEGYYCTNRPVVITGMMDDWPALRKWSLDYFAERFGDREVDVQSGRDASGRFEEERDKFRRKMIFAEYVENVRTSGVTNDFYITANNNSANKDALPELWDDVVQIPEYLDGTSPQNGFFWFGPAGTITPFHHDLTNNLMAQVIGRKRILLAPSWDMPLMKNLRDVYCEVDGRKTPPATRARPGEPQILECFLDPGEILFLPVGCLHFVEALEVSATVSFTNFAFDDNDYTSFYEGRGSV